MTNDDRCAWSELPTHMCGHCTQHPDLNKIPTTRQLAIDNPQPATVAWTPNTHTPTPRDWDDGPRTSRPTSPCRYDPTTKTHLLRSHQPDCTDTTCAGCQPCTHDHGTPVRHCTTTRGCNSHLDPGHHNCPRCLGRVRNALTHIEYLTALLLEEAIHDGLNSEATNQAGPVADPDIHPRRRVWASDHTGPDHHAYVLRDWEQRIRRHLGHSDDTATERYGGITRTLTYLAWTLTDFATDTSGLFRHFAADVIDTHAHLEAVMRAQRGLDRGAPCPACPEPKPRLRRRFAHWCDDPDCTREHDRTGARDTWECPRDRSHWWREADYRRITYQDAVAAGMRPRRKGARIA